MYYYIKNLQGDIVKIINQSGTEVANYVYDAWGNIHSETGDTTIRNLNPFRYCSYVYDEEIVTTDEHPFWVIGKGWVAARDLLSEDILYLQDGKRVEITDVFKEDLTKATTVYNFEVEDWHTYFVSSSKILVHNKCSLSKIKDSFLKKQKLDAHAIKKEVLAIKLKYLNIICIMTKTQKQFLY